MDSLRKKTTPRNLPPRPNLQKSTPFVPLLRPVRPQNKITPPSIYRGKRVSKNLFIEKDCKKNKAKFSFFRLFKKFLLLTFSFSLLILLFVGAFFIYKLNILNKKINTDSNQETPILKTIADISKITSDERSVLKGEENNRINILLLGIAGEGKPGGDLTDTIMIASIDTKEKKVALLSLPRDLYANVPNSNYSAKINSLYKYGLLNNQGVTPLKETIENLTNLSINYYLVVNFSGFEKFIDDIGGINVEVQRDIYDPSYPGPNYSYETFEIKKGFHKLDGATALKYARERHNDPEGDFGRAKRQQQVIQAAKNKFFSNKTLLNLITINKLLNTLGENIKTDITLDEIDSFIKLTKNLDTQNINNAVVDAWKEDSLLKVSHIFYENTRAFILVPRIGNYGEIHELAKNIFDLKIIEKRKEEIKSEDPAVAIVDNTGDYSTYVKVEKLLKKNLKFGNIEKLHLATDFTSATTSIFDLSSGKKPFSLDELIKKIPALPNNDTSSLALKLKEDTAKYDILIILGEDLNEIYSYDEDSIEDLQKSENNQEALLIKKD